MFSTTERIMFNGLTEISGIIRRFIWKTNLNRKQTYELIYVWNLEQPRKNLVISLTWSHGKVHIQL